MVYSSSGSRTNKNYDEMSREELIEFIGADDDPAMSREDLIMMAEAVDEQVEL
jgi:hypothetical protein